jgi:hypothetical protein
MNMNCPYCQQPCQPRYTNSYQEERGLTDLVCDNHKHSLQFEVASRTQFVRWDFLASQQDYRYRIKCVIVDGMESMELIENSSSNILIHLPFINYHITPDNIDDKIKTLLVWM